jgi:DNA-binding MarR family transcriptional regulator
VTDAEATRPDLAAMLQPLTQVLIEAELPVLAAHGISMWGYIVLNALDGGPVRTQAALAEQINADKTRIISTLDQLQAAGLISRQPDQGDRRVRLLSITPAGRRLRGSVRARIQAGEEHLLALLAPADRAAFLRAAQALAALSRDTLHRAIRPGPAGGGTAVGGEATGPAPHS